jgi:hypothetical protein
VRLSLEIHSAGTKESEIAIDEETKICKAWFMFGLGSLESRWTIGIFVKY